MKKLLSLFVLLALFFGLPATSFAQATYTYRDIGSTSAVAVKAPVRVATTAAITLSGTQTIDGIALNVMDRVLVKNQADQTTNGIYYVQSGAWTRAQDFKGNTNVVYGTLVVVNSGTVNGNSFWEVTTANPIYIDGGSSITFQTLAISPINTALASGDIFVGNAGGTATATALSGDCTLTNAGAITCTKTNGSAFATIATTGSVANLSGTVPVAQGGTGVTSITAGAVLVGNGTGNVTVVPPVAGTCLITSGGVWTSGSCTGASGSGTVSTGTLGQIGYYASSSNVVSGNANITISSGAVSIGTTGTQGSVKINGTTSGALTITTQGTAGTPTWTAGTSAGTPAVTASAPLAITTATGNITCTTCATTTNGGALSATAPITISAAGLIALTNSANLAFLNTQQIWTSNQTVQASVLTISTSTFTPTMSTGNNFQVTLVHASCPCTIANPTGTITAGTEIGIDIRQSSSGSDTIGTWGSYYIFSGNTAPTLTTTANYIDTITCRAWDSTHLNCTTVGNFAH